MNWRDQDVVFEGEHYKVIYNQNFIAMPFCVVMRGSGSRVNSYSSDRAARAAVRHYDKQWELLSVR
jgi:hypothetical protein